MRDRPAPALSAGRVRRATGRLRAAGAWWVLGAFAISRVAAYGAGVRYDDSVIPTAWQFIDPVLLKDHLVPSVWFSHTQPPLFNLFIGSVLKFSPLSDARSFHLIFLAMGAALSLTVLALCRTLGAGRIVAVVATIVITCSPAAILFENWLFYTYPMALLVTGLALAVGRWVSTGRIAWFVTVALIAAAMVLTRSLFHPLWFPLVVGVAWLARRPVSRRAALAAALVPFMVIAVVVVKNQVLFGTPGLSSWFGMNFQRMTTEQLAEPERRALIDQRRLSPQADVLAFFPYSAYEPVVPPCTPTHPDVPVLAQPVKADGGPNFNYECFLPIFRQAQRDGLVAARDGKRAVLKGQIASWQFSLQPSSGYTFLDRNRPHVRTYNDVYNRVVLLGVDAPTVVSSPPNVRALYTSPMPLSLTIALAFLVVIGTGAAAMRRWIRRRPLTPADAATVVIALTTLVVFVLGNGLEIGENERFRWMVEPVMLAVLVVWGERLVRRLRSGGDGAGLVGRVRGSRTAGSTRSG